MAMASTTSAAASMLLSGSMSSADGIMTPNLLARAILPCSTSMATLSASAPFPTVTLDLTQNSNPNPNPLQFQRPHHAPFQVPNFFQGQQQPQNFAQAAASLYNQSKFSGLQLSQEIGSSHLTTQASTQQQQQQPSLADSVSAATAAITSDPNFTAVLAAAISSIIGGGHANNNNANTNNNSRSSISNFSGN
ncbi:WRKY transcription factor [Trifolium pratense]|uniref:WRKY transcription factor n=1 Tax=Trifolium pratense TaxID=57577 RepID=A0A2K3M9L7_TRIPR|nr:WRKY transcription factor [Trifolium pratense]